MLCSWSLFLILWGKNYPWSSVFPKGSVGNPRLSPGDDGEKPEPHPHGWRQYTRSGFIRLEPPRAPGKIPASHSRELCSEERRALYLSHCSCGVSQGTAFAFVVWFFAVPAEDKLQKNTCVLGRGLLPACGHSTFSKFIILIFLCLLAHFSVPNYFLQREIALFWQNCSLLFQALFQRWMNYIFFLQDVSSLAGETVMQINTCNKE